LIGQCRRKQTILQQRSQSADWKLNIKFEFTARDTPQQNHHAELGFAHLANYGRALMARANVPMNIRYKVFTKAFKTATLLDGLTVITIGNREAPRYEHWCGKNPEFSQYLRTWGEVGMVKVKTDATPRIGDRGVKCMFVGYSLDHTADCYEMWDPATLRVNQTRDVIWLNRMYYNRVEQAKNIVVEPDMEPVIVYHTQNPVINGPGEGDNHEETNNDDGNDGDDGDNGVHSLPDEFFDAETKQMGNTSYGIDIPTTSTRVGRISRPPPRLIETVAMAQAMNELAAEYKCEFTPAEERFYDAMRELNEMALIGAGIGGGFVNTEELHVMNYNEAIKLEKDKWGYAVKEEHDRMVNNKVWTTVPIDKIPEGTQIMTSAWAMKKKSNGIYRARVNARGFEQIDGEHCNLDTKLSPVTCIVTIIIVMTLIVMAA
jgi:hypothetical protein